jgi:hypothetical protein
MENDLIEDQRECFTGPFGTLFLLGPGSLLILPWEGGEAVVPREDVVAFLRFCQGGGLETLSVDLVASRPNTDVL